MYKGKIYVCGILAKNESLVLVLAKFTITNSERGCIFFFGLVRAKKLFLLIIPSILVNQSKCLIVPIEMICPCGISAVK